MKILFYFLLGMLFNSFHLGQTYFRKKLQYFNSKYQIIEIFPEINISLNERFLYSFSHSVTSGIVCFIICLIIQSILNYLFYNSKNILFKMKSRANNNFRQIMYSLNKYYKKYFLVIFINKLIFVIFICYSIINFSQIYTGGITDLIAGTIWTFIFIQIFPFIYCIIFAFIIKKEIKNEKSCLLKFGKSIYF